MTVVLSLAAALLTLHIVAFFSRMQFMRGYKRGLRDGFMNVGPAQPRPVDLQTGPQKSPGGDHHE
jgi:hypothetical protein